MTSFETDLQEQGQSWTQTALNLLASGMPEEDVVQRLQLLGLAPARAEAIVSLMAGRRERLDWGAARKDIGQGALWFVLGTVVTAGSYYFSTPGSSFLLAWGAIIFGLLQFLRGWRRAGRRGLNLALGLMAASAVILLLLFGASLALPSLTRTYRDDVLGFELRYPWTYAVEVSEEPDEQLLSFAPQYGWGRERRTLEVTIDTSGYMEGWKQNSLVAVLRASVMGEGSTLVKGVWPTVIDSRPAAESSFHVYPEPPEEQYAAWLALLTTRRTSFWLGALGPQGTSDTLEPFYRRFVDSFRHDAPREAIGPEVTGSGCAEDLSRFSDLELGFGVCHRDGWMAVPIWNEANEGEGVQFFSPVDQEVEGLAAVLVYPELANAEHWGDAERAQQMLDGMVSEGVTVDREPQITIRDDFRILQGGWRAEDLVGAEPVEVVTRVAWILHEKGSWWLELVGQAQHLDSVESNYEQFLSSFEIVEAAP
jgi:hypothetical protein